MTQKIALISNGWLGDSIACTAAAVSIYEERGVKVDFYCKWKQLQPILGQDKRYNFVLFNESFLGNFFLKNKLKRYTKIYKEPFPWSYKEPFTSEIRRLVGCDPSPQISIDLKLKRNNLKINPQVAISRDLYSRNFGRDIDEFIRVLSMKTKIVWVGLSPHKSSKRGKRKRLIDDLQVILASEAFIGPEGGLMWLSGSVGVPTIYFSENIEDVNKKIKSGNAWSSLGAENIWGSEIHCCLPPFCTNELAIEKIEGHLSNIKNNLI